jgi:hypothetical protein
MKDCAQGWSLGEYALTIVSCARHITMYALSRLLSALARLRMSYVGGSRAFPH